MKVSDLWQQFFILGWRITGKLGTVMVVRTLFICLFILAGTALPGITQEKDTTRKDTTNILDSKVARELIDAVTVKAPLDKSKKNVRSEDIFKRYQGKIIRRIIIRRIGFERSIYDTTRSIRNTVTKIADALHKDTRKSVIQDNLFFRENKPLNPYLLADNERYLRDLDFILDSKIIVRPVRGTKDSVDVEVTTRDIFSFGVRAKASGIDKYSIGIYDANLAGMGQRVQTDFLVENERVPVIGKSFTYSKNSLGGSLINLSAGYTELNNGRSYGEENEYAYYVRLDRPLVSPYSRMAGGIEISRNWSVNVFQRPDSLFTRYRYEAQDAWVGYNIGVKNSVENRSRHFVAVRYYRQHFDRQPLQEFQRARRIYNDQQVLLGEITFYNQNFYKTSYVYGFGRTEDVPYGQTINITAGWANEVGMNRFYLGSYAVRRIVRPSGRFYDFEIGGGSYFNNDIAEDGVLYGNGTYYSKLYDIGRSKVRHQFGAGYARAFNNRVRDLLTLNRELPGFTADSLYGFQRAFLRSETTVFTPFQFVGFRFAPFVSLEGAFIRLKDQLEFTNNVFWGSTGGVRIRNENLIFGTVELRAYYFPKTVPGVDQLSFKVTTNIRIKYSGTFVRPPDFVRYN